MSNYPYHLPGHLEQLDGRQRDLALVRLSWKTRLAQIIRRHAPAPENGRGVTSDQTRHNLRTGLFRLFSQLRVLGHDLEDPADLAPEHVQALLNWMDDRWQAGSLKSSTIQGYVSYLRKFTRWIGHEDFFGAHGIKLRDPSAGTRDQAAAFDKSWEAAGVDIAAKIDEAWAIEPWVAMALLAQATFGLRRKEAVCLKPARAYLPTGHLQITEGTKGGRHRLVPIHTMFQLEVVATLVDFCDQRPKALRQDYLGGPLRTLSQNLSRYTKVLRTIGITKDIVGTTGHGLRAGFVCRTLEAHGVTAPVRGGDVSAQDCEVVEAAYTAASRAAGHSRHSIVGMYAGNPNAKGDVPHPEQLDVSRVDFENIQGIVARLRDRGGIHRHTSGDAPVQVDTT